MKTLKLREGKERSLKRHHPWIFESAIAKGSADSGETVRVEAADGAFLGWAAFSPASKIRARVWSFDATQRIDASFFIAAVARSTGARARFDIKSDGLRLIHGESDGLPGLIVDRYGDTLVAQFTSAGVERWKGIIADALLAATGLTRLYERSDASSRALEGLPEVKGWLRGGDASTPTDLVLHEHEWKLGLSIAEGHKTGFYLDQRDSRKKFADYAQRLGFQRVLNCFCYTGGFTVAALAGLRAGGFAGGHVTSIDSSGPALEQAQANVALNGLDASQATFLDADVNASLRQFLDQGRTFDAIVLDPPKFAPTVAHAERAARAYKDINLSALRLLAPGGLLMSYSCSGGISAELFQKIVAGAALDAGASTKMTARIVQRLQGSADHPVDLAFPEGEYLKGLLLQVD